MDLRSYLNSHPRYWEFLRYSVVGFSSTVIDFGIFALLTDGYGWRPLSANPISFLLGVTNGFIWNRYWTFKGAAHQEPVSQYVRFVLVNLGGVLIDQAVLATALGVGPLLGLSSQMSKWVGKVVAIPFVVAWNFSANVRWTFHRRHLSADGEVPIAPSIDPQPRR
jgi:putative flippase GtrA